MFSKWSNTPSRQPSDSRGRSLALKDNEESQSGWKALRIRSQSKHRASAVINNSTPKIDTQKRLDDDTKEDVDLPSVNPLSPISVPSGWFESDDFNGSEEINTPGANEGSYQFKSLSFPRNYGTSERSLAITLNLSEENTQTLNPMLFQSEKPELQTYPYSQTEKDELLDLIPDIPITSLPHTYSSLPSTHSRISTLDFNVSHMSRAFDAMDRKHPSSRSSGDTTLGDFESRLRISGHRSHWMFSDLPDDDVRVEEIRDDDTMCSTTAPSEVGEMNAEDTKTLLRHHGKERKSVLDMFKELDFCVDRLNQDALDLENLEQELKAINSNNLILNSVEQTTSKDNSVQREPKTAIKKREVFEPISGYMTKFYQKGVFKSWKRRFFILSPDKLYYFRSHESTHETIGVIPITKDSDCFISSYPQLKDKFVFEIVSEEKVKPVFLYCDNLDEMRNWVKGIRKVILNQRDAEESKVAESNLVTEASTPQINLPVIMHTPNITKNSQLQSTVTILHELNGNPPLSISTSLKRASSLPSKSQVINKTAFFPHGSHLRNTSISSIAQDLPYVLPRTVSDDDLASIKSGSLRFNQLSPLRQDHTPELIVGRRGSNSSLLMGPLRNSSVPGSVTDIPKAIAETQKLNVLDSESPIQSALALLDMIHLKTRRGSRASFISATASTVSNDSATGT